MPMIGARFYTQLDATQVRCDVLQGELAKVICTIYIYFFKVFRISVSEHTAFKVLPRETFFANELKKTSLEAG